eukprot:5006356-Amphidinium_carterae.1
MVVRLRAKSLKAEQVNAVCGSIKSGGGPVVAACVLPVLCSRCMTASHVAGLRRYHSHKRSGLLSVLARGA